MTILRIIPHNYTPVDFVPIANIPEGRLKWIVMPETQPTIERLPVPTQAKLRSTQLLTSVPQVVSELVQNSLDANAARIDIGLHCKEWMCWVRDDGHGISKAGLESFGRGEGGRYSKWYVLRTMNDSHCLKDTSKTYDLGAAGSTSTFGFRGEGWQFDGTWIPSINHKRVQPLPLPRTSPAWKYVPGPKNREIHGP